MSLAQDGDSRVETILFTLPFSMDLYRSDGNGEKAPRLGAHSLAYRSGLDNQHVVTIVSGPLPSGLAPRDASRFTQWAAGKKLDFHSSFGDLIYFRDGVRFRHDTTDYGELTGSYSYRYEGPHRGTVVMSYDEGGNCELQFTFVSETTGVILGKGCRNRFGIFEFSLGLQETPTFVPVILKSAGRNRSFYSSEMTLTNRWSEQSRLQYTYTAHAGGGSGTAYAVLGPGQQIVVPDAIAYLKALGMSIPDSGNRLGTLKVEVEGVADVGVETKTFNSELTVTSLDYPAGETTLNFSFVSDQIQAIDHTAEFSLLLEKGEQRIVPNIVDELRRQGVEGIGPRGRPIAGALFIDPTTSFVVGVRTGSPDGRGGQYGVSYSPVELNTAFRDSAWIYGLQQNAENRSNLALVNAGQDDASDSVFEIDIYDGVTGTRVNTVTEVRVPARRWRQFNAILAEHAPGTTQGYVQIRTVSGKNSFLAYAVINDGAAPGQRSGDGAYLAGQD